ncbi:hypothetical protein AK812_SmicGene43592 [Symbiodinium microadriaticum]|uniref:Uncharacterized protein n=1 Tax=Symbiodinium microadriaticum TaxID=2951 RepID=A0A1Q9C0M5_SYMMI|nr:hypothetical protein AK812_SmicGene43592 [Symbiodinium microadriaticum]
MTAAGMTDVNSSGLPGPSSDLFRGLGLPKGLKRAAMQQPAAPLMAPSNLQVEVRADRSLVVTWDYDRSDANVTPVFHLTVAYFDPEGPMLDPDETRSMTCKQGTSMHVEARDGPEALKACTVSVSLQAATQTSPDLRSSAVRAQTSWDDVQSQADGAQDLEERRKNLVGQLDTFSQVRGCKMNVVIVGGQHHGNSCFINHVHRCWKNNLMANDEMESAPAGMAENTQEISALYLDEKLCLIDTPAIPNMGSEMADAFRSLLNAGHSSGTRRRQLAQGTFMSNLRKPPHAAIVVMSLCHWRDQHEEMQGYLRAMAKELKNASGGRVTFPFVVTATHRDEFLRDSKASRPHEELNKVLDAMKRAANTAHVFAVSNYHKDSSASAAVNKQTFDLLSQLVTLAIRQDTGVVVAQSQNQYLAAACAGVIVLAALCACKWRL